jgi:predicted cupin superfamily sugar epimerase
MALSAREIIELLKLKPATCGYMGESYRSVLQLSPPALPAGYSGPHSLGNGFYFLVTPQTPVTLHRLRSDQMYHYYLGNPLEVLLLYADGKCETRIVGPDLAAGMRPQLFIPGGTFHTARVCRDGEYSLLGTSVWIRAEPSDVELGDPVRLAGAYPDAKTQIASFTS